MSRVMQANCGRGRAETIELGVRLLESKSLFALVQELYVGVERINVLPDGVRSFVDQRGAIYVNHPDVICMPVEPLTNNFGVCVCIKGSFGSNFLCAAYCQFDSDDDYSLITCSEGKRNMVES